MAEKIEVGTILEGKVSKIKPFGLIVSLPGGNQGLVHISHISTSFIKNINEYIAIGEVVKVKVLSFDKEANKISLSIKEATDQTKKVEKERSPEVVEYHPKTPIDSNACFEDKFKDWVKNSNERQAGLNKRNKRR